MRLQEFRAANTAWDSTKYLSVGKTVLHASLSRLLNSLAHDESAAQVCCLSVPPRLSSKSVPGPLPKTSSTDIALVGSNGLYSFCMPTPESALCRWRCCASSPSTARAEGRSTSSGLPLGSLLTIQPGGPNTDVGIGIVIANTV